MGEFIDYPHAPSHLFVPCSVYMVTAGTYQKRNIFNSAERLQKVIEELLNQTAQFSWELHVWVVFPNHYHFIARAPEDPKSLVSVIRGLHSITAKIANAIDSEEGRRVWHNYWDTCITSEKSYLRRLKYILVNPVRHGFVADPGTYPYCNYIQFMDSTDPSFREDILLQRIDSLSIWDDY